MFDDFLMRAALAAVGTAFAAGGLGCFVVWRRMAYFGDATSHGAILGVALALAFDAKVLWGVLLVSLAMGLGLHVLTRRGQSANTVLGVMAHGALAAGLVAVTQIPGVRVDLNAYLFGDILTVSKTDLKLIWGGALVVNLLLLWRWQALLTATLHPDMARAAGLRPERESLILVLMMSLVVAVALKVVGALLITALLIVPAAAAGRLARTPETMALLAVGIGAGAGLGGLQLSLVYDTPVGPSMVCVMVLAYAGLVALRARMGRA